jgi:cyclic beta-1,2-glucan synthetase
MQRAGIESILGLRLRGKVQHLDPCIPKAWPRFEMKVRYRSARYEILVENPGGAGRGIASAQLDDTVIVERPLRVPLADDGNTHHLRVRLGPTPVRGTPQLNRAEADFARRLRH